MATPSTLNFSCTPTIWFKKSGPDINTLLIDIIELCTTVRNINVYGNVVTQNKNQSFKIMLQILTFRLYLQKYF